MTVGCRGLALMPMSKYKKTGDLLQLTAESVPLTETPRLEAREFADAVPTFAALGSDPVPVLEAIAREMENYDGTQWATKLTTLSGIELEDARRSRREFELEIAASSAAWSC